jgi:succinate-acetate transporter protein
MEEQRYKLADMTANPGALGLAAFGLTTVLLNLVNAKLIPFDSMIVAMGIFYGGLAQLIAGSMEWKKGNTFGMVAFTSYGVFWLSFIAIQLLPSLGLAPAASNMSIVGFLLLWAIFTIIMFVGTLRICKALAFVFGTADILFLMLAAHAYTGNADIGTIAGYFGLIVGFAALYTGLAQVINELYHRELMPIWPYKPKDEAGGKVASKGAANH